MFVRYNYLCGLQWPRSRYSSACPLPVPNRSFSEKGLNSIVIYAEHFSCTYNSRVSLSSTLRGGVIVWKNGFSYTYWMPYKIRIYNVPMGERWATVVQDISNGNYEIKLLYLRGIGKHNSPPVFVFCRTRYTPHVYISGWYVCGVCDKLSAVRCVRKKFFFSILNI